MQADPVDYMARAQWLRAVVLGANDGLVSVASLMVGVGAVGQSSKAMLVSGLAGLVAGACSMAIGEFVSVYAQYDIEVAERERRRRDCGSEKEGVKEEEEGSLPNPLLAAAASALAFSLGAVLPLLAGAFIMSGEVRVGVVCAVSSLGLAGFGAAGAVLGGANVPNSVLRLLIGGWLAMLVTYGVLRVSGLVFGMHVSSA
ncbi:vacuolar iron transporter homolog 2-like [Musa acuminata AAA Group]|uniref:vacuolar iron transporter homolog 2-like n=1 Tax=Musa acuminata AAA Group TaxID=214697 RepID=UPI0031CED6C7